jgi:Phage integrase family.
MPSSAVLQDCFQEKKRSEYRAFVASISSDDQFESGTWHCDRLKKHPADRSCVLHFVNVPEQFKEITKYFIVLKLLGGMRVSGARQYVIRLIWFLRFIAEAGAKDVLQCCGSSFVVGFKAYLDDNCTKEQVKYGTWQVIKNFFDVMQGWEGRRLYNHFAGNPFAQPFHYNEKLIPPFVESQLDRLFLLPEVQLHIRVAYWMMRLFPTRVSEVCAMQPDCVKRFDGHFVLFLPMWKQNGGYNQAEMRSIHIEYEGMGKHLIDLLHEQQDAHRTLSLHVPEHQRGLLLVYKKAWYRYGKWAHTTIKKHNILAATPEHINVFFERYCELHNVRDADGSPYILKSHMLRHNGITDRLAEGFTIEQIAHMTSHKNDRMILSSYNHLDLRPEVLTEKQRLVSGEPAAASVMFGGRILNMSPQTEARLLKNMRAHRVRGGICSDITDCKCDMQACLNCRFFVPEIEQLPFFKEQATAWSVKAARFKAFPIIHKNAIANAALYQEVVTRMATYLEVDDHEKNP